MTIDPKFGEHDSAMFEQVQARALDIIRTRKVWFLYAITDQIEGEYLLAAPEFGDATDLPPRILTRALIAAAIDTLAELRSELEDRE